MLACIHIPRFSALESEVWQAWIEACSDVPGLSIDFVTEALPMLCGVLADQFPDLSEDERDRIAQRLFDMADDALDLLYADAAGGVH